MIITPKAFVVAVGVRLATADVFDEALQNHTFVGDGACLAANDDSYIKITSPIIEPAAPCAIDDCSDCPEARACAEVCLTYSNSSHYRGFELQRGPGNGWPDDSSICKCLFDVFHLGDRSAFPNPWDLPDGVTSLNTFWGMSLKSEAHGGLATGEGPPADSTPILNEIVFCYSLGTDPRCGDGGDGDGGDGDGGDGAGGDGGGAGPGSGDEALQEHTFVGDGACFDVNDESYIKITSPIIEPAAPCAMDDLCSECPEARACAEVCLTYGNSDHYRGFEVERGPSGGWPDDVSQCKCLYDVMNLGNRTAFPDPPNTEWDLPDGVTYRAGGWGFSRGSEFSGGPAMGVGPVAGSLSPTFDSRGDPEIIFCYRLGADPRYASCGDGGNGAGGDGDDSDGAGGDGGGDGPGSSADEGDCSPAYVLGGTYSVGDTVSATTTSTETSTEPCTVGSAGCGSNGFETTTTETTEAHNYLCKEGPVAAFCSQRGFAPGGIHGDTAWTDMGVCEGTASDTAGVPEAWSGGGCPESYSGGTNYDAGDVVSVSRRTYKGVYRCTEAPRNFFCGMTGFEPGSGQYWNHAWEALGSCTGSIAPTSSPNFEALADVGGCPDEWAFAQNYEEGDRVSSSGLVFQCRPWPYSGRCNQAGFEPSLDSSHWKEAWDVVGYCNGSMSPTTSPTIDVANSIGACPNEWERGSNIDYEEGDMVSVVASATPLRKVAYKCRPWPFSGHCGQYPPDGQGGNLGWTLAGPCEGSIGPTASPSFDSIKEVDGGCPESWSPSNTDYEAGDLVAYSVSEDPKRDVVFRCREFPYTAFCGRGAGYEPSTRHGHLAWTLVGSCSGTMAPTGSPVEYRGDCTFRACQTVERTVTFCVPGSRGCSCALGTPRSAFCERTVEEEECTDEPVDGWSNDVDYSTGDVVRVGTKRFKCRRWPYNNWCNQYAYQPDLEGGLWEQAWHPDGVCV